MGISKPEYNINEYLNKWRQDTNQNTEREKAKHNMKQPKPKY